MKTARAPKALGRLVLFVSFSIPIFLWFYACGPGPGLFSAYADIVGSPSPSASPSPGASQTPNPLASPSPIAKYLTVVSQDAAPLRDLGNFSFFAFNGYLYAGGGTMSYGGTNYSLFKSADGSSWTSLSLAYPPIFLIPYDGKLWGFRGSGSSDATTYFLRNYAAIDTGANKGIYALSSAECYEYDETLKTWTFKADYPFTSRTGAVFFANGQYLYVTGGRALVDGTPQEVPLSDIWRSGDGGLSWSKVNPFSANYYGYVALPARDGMSGDQLLDSYDACQETYNGNGTMYFYGQYATSGGTVKSGLGRLSLDYGYIDGLIGDENDLGISYIAVRGSRLYALGSHGYGPTVWSVFSYQLR